MNKIHPAVAAALVVIALVILGVMVRNFTRGTSTAGIQNVPTEDQAKMQTEAQRMQQKAATRPVPVRP